MNQNDSSGFLIKPWPVLLDHYNHVPISLFLIELLLTIDETPYIQSATDAIATG